MGSYLNRNLLKIAIILFLLNVLIPLNAEEKHGPVKIMLVFPASQYRIWDMEVTKGFQNAMNSQKDFIPDIYLEFLAPGTSAYEESIERLEHDISLIKPDFLISISPSVNDVFLGMENPDLDGIRKIFIPTNENQIEGLLQLSESYIVGGSTETAMRDSLMSIERILPDLETLIVVSGVGDIDYQFQNIFNGVIAEKERFFETRYMIGYPQDQLKEELSLVPGPSAVYYLPMILDRDGKTNDMSNLLPQISASAKGPVFSYTDTALGFGALGGTMSSAEAYGKQAGEIIISLYNGKDIQRVVPGSYISKYDWKQMQRWGIDENLLPENSVIINKPLTLLEKYRIQIIFIVIFISVETVMIILLIFLLRSKHEKEFLLKKSEDLLQRSESTARLGGWDYDPVTRGFSHTKELPSIFGLDSHEVMDLKTLLSVLHHEDRARLTGAIEQIIETGEPRELEFRIVSEDGRQIWAQARGAAVKTGASVTGISGTIQDISLKKEAEIKLVNALEQKEYLLRELHHRVKNNLAVINSLITLEIQNADQKELEYVLHKISSRINTIAVFQEQIYVEERAQKSRLTEYIHSIVVNIIEQAGEEYKPPEVIYEISDMEISLELMVPLGIIINEVVSNSIYHAFKDAENPWIKLSSAYDKKTKIYSLTVSDNGVGVKDINSLENRTSVGYLLIFSLVEQIGGEVKLSGDDGLSITVSFMAVDSIKDYS